MRKKILFITLLVTTCVNAQNFTMNELVNIFKTNSIEKTQEFLEKKGLTFMSVKKEGAYETIIYGYSPLAHYNDRATYFVNLSKKNYDGDFYSIGIQFHSRQKYNDWLNTVKNTYGAKWIETKTDTDGITNIYNGKTLEFYFGSQRNWDNKKGEYVTSYYVSLYWLSNSNAFSGTSDSGQNNKQSLTYDKGVIINGVKWATRNVDTHGIFAATPQDKGMLYNWTTANNVCPSGWRLPTREELNRLANAENEWTTTPVNGRIFNSGNHTLFLPAAGCRINGILRESSYGFYWSSNVINDGSFKGFTYSMQFNSSFAPSSNNEAHPEYMYSVRCVAK